MSSYCINTHLFTCFSSYFLKDFTQMNICELLFNRFYRQLTNNKTMKYSTHIKYKKKQVMAWENWKWIFFFLIMQCFPSVYSAASVNPSVWTAQQRGISVFTEGILHPVFLSFPPSSQTGAFLPFFPFSLETKGYCSAQGQAKVWRSHRC